MSEVRIRAVRSTDALLWDAYVHAHPQATLYHLYGWRNVIERTYGHKTYYLAATKNISAAPNTRHSTPKTRSLGSNSQLIGVLPLVHLKSVLFGNSLISMPFVDLGGILADDAEIERTLLDHAIKLGRNLKVGTIELRNVQPLSCLNLGKRVDPGFGFSIVTNSHKVRMTLDLLDSSEELMRYFKPRLRTKIRKSLRENLKSSIGGIELINDFYEVFSRNMRDLGSPVHSKKLMMNVLDKFPEKAKIILVYQDSQPMGCSLVVGFRNTLESPWVSSLRKFTHLNPNIRLYWAMLEYARKEGYSFFEFGRSTIDEGPYHFKKQWGAKPERLNWQYASINSRRINKDQTEKSKFGVLVRYWQKLPVPLTQFMGPMIRKQIGL